MGDEIERRYFNAEDFSAFRERLEVETDLLRTLFEHDEFSRRGDVAGFELEAWLVDERGDPLDCNERYIETLNNPLVVPELATFNVELNGSPSRLTGRVFTRLRDELSATWAACRETADAMGCGLVTTGILPTIRKQLLNSNYMSAMTRYQSLNDRIMALRDGRPLEIEIEGDEPLSLRHSDVMLEAAATSFQIHLQCRPENAVRDYNASMVASAPVVAVSANSPTLFGHRLWEETRIPLFEQAVDTGMATLPRVSFGRDYIHESLVEVFEENRDWHQILLPALHESEPNQFAHVRFHNGTLWRWNRPLIGFDFDGQIHLRIEHRVVPAGPTIADCIANSALYFGLVRGMSLMPEPIEKRMTFECARDNFYKAARYGLNARLLWPSASGEREVGVRELLEDELLPLARRGLQSTDIPDEEIDEHLSLIAARVDQGQNGAAWQRRWLGMNGRDLNGLVLAYKECQDRGDPVHTWPL